MKDEYTYTHTHTHIYIYIYIYIPATGRRTAFGRIVGARVNEETLALTPGATTEGSEGKVIGNSYKDAGSTVAFKEGFFKGANIGGVRIGGRLTTTLSSNSTISSLGIIMAASSIEL